LKAEIVVSTIPDFKTNLNLVSFYKNHRPEGVIVVMSHDIKDAKLLYSHGASFVVMPHYLGAKYASKMIESHLTEDSPFEKEKTKHLEYLNQREKFTG
jgi:Trk K+ transport system NAD-binding subunit